MDRIEIRRPYEEQQLAARLEHREIGLVFGPRYVGKETLIQRAMRRVEGLAERPLWVDLTRPDPKAPQATLRSLCLAMLAQSDAELRAQCARVQDLTDALTLLRRARLGQQVAVLWLGPRSFARGALPFMSGLYHRLQSAWIDRDPWAPRLILSGDLLDRHWTELRNMDGGPGFDFDARMAYLGNKAEPVFVKPFDRAQTDALLEGLGLLGERAALEDALAFLGGHPRLLTMALRTVASRDVAASALLRTMRHTRGGPLAPFFAAMYRAILDEGLYSEALEFADGNVPGDPFARVALESWGIGIRPELSLFPAVFEGFHKVFLASSRQ